MNKKTPIKAMLANAEPALIADKALARQNAGQYKEAIELYKQLLKQADNKDWQQALAQCYLRRALSFAEKNMVKEAVVLWDNYAQNAEAPYQAYDCYIAWLLQTNNIAKVKACLGQLSTQQLDEQYPDLASLLGLLILTEKPELESALPKDSLFIRHLALVRAALTAFQSDKPEQLEQSLKQLPFRSAFRDFRSLLTAALALPEALELAQSLLSKIPARSPYQQAARLLLSTTHQGSTLANECLQFEHKQRQIIGTIKKFSKKQADLLEGLAKQKGLLSDKITFNFAIEYRELFGPDLARQFCRALLTTYPAGLRDFNKHFGLIDEFEQCRLKALAYERDRDFCDAEYYWKQCIAHLNKQAEANAYKIALIMRHIAEHAQSLRDGTKWRIDSLEHDPNDRESYINILHYYESQSQQADEYKRWLEQGLKTFPQDIDLLVLAIKAALANKAFKKATQYAQAILKIDPVNTFAKQVLFTSHLAHARKLIKTKKFHLVEKEIQQAEKLTIGKRYQAQAQLLRGFLVLLAENRQQGLQQIVEALQKMNDGSVCAHFCVTIETLLLGLTLPAIVRDLPPPAKSHQLSEQELARLVQLILQYYGDDASNKTVLHKALEKMQVFIKPALKRKTFNEETVLSLCQCLASIGHFELLGYCAKLALSQWCNPIWVYYKIYAGVKGQAAGCLARDIVALQFNLQMAKDEVDQRAEMLIRRFIEQYYEAKNPFGRDFYDDDDYDDEDDDDDEFNAIDELFSHLPPDIHNKIENKIEGFMRKGSPERMIKILSKLLPKNMDISCIILYPDLMSALSILHAASELGVDTGVTVADVLKACNVSGTSKPPSFPFF